VVLLNEPVWIKAANDASTDTLAGR